MPWIPNRNPGDVAPAAWGNAIRDASTVTFTNAAERDTYWPAATAPLGALCVTLDNFALWQCNDRSGARRWTPPWNMGWGIVAAPTPLTTTASAGGASPVDITNLSATFNMVGQRRYRYTVMIPLMVLSATGIAVITICDGPSNFVYQQANTQPVAGNYFGMHLVWDELTSTGTAVVRKARYQATAGTVTAQSTASSPAFFTVTDLGPATAIPTALEVADA